MKELTINKNILTENSQLLQDYFKDLNKHPIYSGDEQIELARLAKSGDDIAREKLINSNLKFVVTCAKQYVGQGVPLMDLINSGNLGLIQAIDNYDPDRGYKFLSFAVWYIRREIIRAIYNTGRTIRYPVTYIGKISKVKKTYEAFLTQKQREPTDEELINLTNLTQRQYNRVILNKSYCQSLDTPITSDSEATVEDIIPDSENNIENIFVSDAIESCLKRFLNKREFQVITEFYGLCGQTERPIKEIAEELGIGDERVRQIRKASINKLRERCGNILKSLI